MAKSFFERLTGSVRVNDDEGEELLAGDSPVAAAPRPMRTKRRPPESATTGRVLHPIAPSDGQVPSSVDDAPEEGQLTVDIWDDGENLVIQSVVGGVKPEDVDISLQEDTLTIRGTRRRVHEVDEANFYYRELFWGTFSRSIILPEEVDFGKADATVKNGLLTIRLPKKDRSEKKIRVRGGE